VLKKTLTVTSQHPERTAIDLKAASISAITGF
jgi:hypothetical protein